jgi:DNA-directed RNA polymerase specialized sigma24 family protein
VVERLMKAMREVRPGTVRQFFALANQHMRWELNDLARRLDIESHAIELRESAVLAPEESSASQLSPNMRRIMDSIESLPEEEREVFTLNDAGRSAEAIACYQTALRADPNYELTWANRAGGLS